MATKMKIRSVYEIVNKNSWERGLRIASATRREAAADKRSIVKKFNSLSAKDQVKMMRAMQALNGKP